MADFESTGKLIWKELWDWYAQIVTALPNLLLAVVVIVIFYIASRFIYKWTDRGFESLSHNQNLSGLAAACARLAVLASGIMIALGILNLDKTVMSLLAGVGVIGLALGFAFQDLASNFIAGIMISIREPFQKGQVIEVSGVMGTVEKINLRNTLLRNFDGQCVIIPNKDIITQPIFNYHTYKVRRVVVGVGISYGDDMDGAKADILEEVRKLDFVLSDPAPNIWYKQFGGSSIDMEIMAWIKYPGTNFFEARDTIMRVAKKAIDQGGYTIPFPIRTLDFDIKGGRTLAEMLPSAKVSKESLHQ